MPTKKVYVNAEDLVKRYSDLGGELHMIELDRPADSISAGASSLGLALSGNRNPKVMSVFVVAIQPDSVAALDGRIHVGDELIEVGV